MTVWQHILPVERFCLLLLVFLALCTQVYYLLAAFEHRRTLLYGVTAVWMTALFALLVCLLDSDLLNGAPLWALWTAVLLSAAFDTAILLHHRQRLHSRITRSSIKESMDNLPVAGCFFTEQGRVKLCNRQMYRLFRAMSGLDLQSLDELHRAMADCAAHGVSRTQSGDFAFPDGCVWRYRERMITADDGRRYTESTFIDITVFARVNEELHRDNEELERINAKLQKMYVRAEDRIREREYLAFKMKIHDDIGRSLAVIRRILQDGPAGTDPEKQLRVLSMAAATLVYSPSADSTDPFDRLLNQAAELGIEVRLDGMLPLEPLIYELVVQAVRECVTNCARHAHGTIVFVRVNGLPGGYTVTITNDGQKPKTQIIEGGGLSNLRQCVENAGGEMTLSSRPAFALKLTLMREEMEL